MLFAVGFGFVRVSLRFLSGLFGVGLEFIFGLFKAEGLIPSFLPSKHQKTEEKKHKTGKPYLKIVLTLVTLCSMHVDEKVPKKHNLIRLLKLDGIESICAGMYYNNYNYTTQQLHYTTTTPTQQLQLQLQQQLLQLQQLYDCNYTTLITLHHSYKSTTLQLQLQLQYITLHPAVVGEVTTATIATNPANTTPTLFGQSVDSLCHPWFTTTNVSYRFPILKLPPPPCAVLLVRNKNVKIGWNWKYLCWYVPQFLTVLDIPGATVLHCGQGGLLLVLVYVLIFRDPGIRLAIADMCWKLIILIMHQIHYPSRVTRIHYDFYRLFKICDTVILWWVPLDKAATI